MDEAINSLGKGFERASASGAWPPDWWPAWLPTKLPAGQDPVIMGILIAILLFLLLNFLQNVRLAKRLKKSAVTAADTEKSIEEKLDSSLQSQRALLNEGLARLSSSSADQSNSNLDMERIGKALATLHKKMENIEANTQSSFDQLTTAFQDNQPTVDHTHQHGSSELMNAMAEIKGDLQKQMILLDELLALRRAVTKMIGEDKVRNLVEKERKLAGAAKKIKNSELVAPAGTKKTKEKEQDLISKKATPSPIDDGDDLIPRNRR